MQSFREGKTRSNLKVPGSNGPPPRPPKPPPPPNPSSKRNNTMPIQSKYQFKVGDKGRTSDGNNYEVIRHIKKDMRTQQETLLVIISNSNGEDILFTDTKGEVLYVGYTTEHLLLPTRTVYVNLYGHTRESLWYDTAERAVANASPTAMAVAVPLTIPATNRDNENDC